jgi:hypothetical protein
MTTQLLATELANLIQESKRKHNDLRQVQQLPQLIPTRFMLTCRSQAAEKSLEELKSLKSTTEQGSTEGIPPHPSAPLLHDDH